MTISGRSTIRIFISHSSKDNQFGEKLAEDLRTTLGDANAVWYDSSGLLGGHEWWKKIVEEIKARNVFIVLLSPDAVASNWVNDEIAIAWKLRHSQDTLIIPLLYRKCEIRDDLDILQIIDFQQGRSYDEAFQDLLLALGQVASLTSADAKEKGLHDGSDTKLKQGLTQQIMAQIEIASQEKDWADVIRKVNYLLKQAPDTVTSRMYGLQGVALHQTGKLPQAEEAFDTALALVSDRQQRLTILGNYSDLHTAEQRWDQASLLIDEALRLMPQDITWTLRQQQVQYSLLLKEALVLHNTHRYKEAIILYNKAIELLPDTTTAYEKRADSFIELKELQKALTDLDRAIQLLPTSTSALSSRGKVHTLLHHHQRALQDLNTALERDPYLAIAYSYRGEIYRLRANYPAALEDFNRAIELGAQDAPTYCSRGITFLFLQKYPDAIQDLNQALDNDPHYAFAYLNRGDAYRLSHNYPDAIKDLNHAIELDAKDASAYCCRGATQLASKNYRAAIPDLSQALTLNSQYRFAYWNRGEAYRLSNNPRQALADFNELLRLDPSYARAYYRRGQVHYTLKNNLQAYRDFVRALELKAQFPNLKGERDKAFHRLTRSLREQRLEFTVGALSDPGIKRKHKPNEDSMFAAQWQRDSTTEALSFGLFVVADGMGGHANGQEASRIAIQATIDFMLPKLAKIAITSGEDLRLLLVGAVEQANFMVYQRNKELRADMGTTVTGALVVGATAYVANVGDSRTYLYRAYEGLKKVTNDHSVVASLVNAGIIKPDDIYTHPKRNQIYRSLGEKAAVEVDSFIVQLQTGDKLLVCSDGLWDMVRDPQIESVLKIQVPDPQETADALVQAALEGGGEDNVSVIVISFGKTPQRSVGQGIELLAKPDGVHMPQL